MGDKLRADRMADGDPKDLVESDVARCARNLEHAGIRLRVDRRQVGALPHDLDRIGDLQRSERGLER